MIAVMHEPDRLAELRRQRALVQRHLEWLDQEIENATGQVARAPSSAEAKPIIALATALPARAASGSAAAPTPVESLLGEQPRAASDVRQDVKKGCLLYFAAAIAAVMFTVAVLYFAFGIGRR